MRHVCSQFRTLKQPLRPFRSSCRLRLESSSIHLRLQNFCVLGAQAGDAQDIPSSQGTPSAKSISEIDELINMLLGCRSQDEFRKAVADNILAFDQQFWLRLAARNDAAEDEEKERLSALATTVMHVVEKAVTTTEEQLQSSGKVVQTIMKAAADENGQWQVPLPEDKVEAIRQALEENSDSLDEAFLSSCFAYIKKASDDKLVEIVHLLQRILQLYAARYWSQMDASGKDDALLLDILATEESNWQNMIHDLVAAGELSEASFMAQLQKKMEQTVLQMKSGSHSQRVHAEYLKEVEERAKTVFAEQAGIAE